MSIVNNLMILPSKIKKYMEDKKENDRQFRQIITIVDEGSRTKYMLGDLCVFDSYDDEGVLHSSVFEERRVQDIWTMVNFPDEITNIPTYSSEYKDVLGDKVIIPSTLLFQSQDVMKRDFRTVFPFVLLEDSEFVLTREVIEERLYGEPKKNLKTLNLEGITPRK